MTQPDPQETRPGRELWLVRHGQTVANEGGRLSGWADVALTPKGEAEARALRPLLASTPFDGVFSSDLTRAVATARLAFGEPTPDPRLREIDFGDLEGERWVDLDPGVARALLEFEGFAAPGGEALADLEARVTHFVEALPPGRYLLFTHGGVVRLLTHRLGLARFLPNGALVALDWDRGEVLFVREVGGEGDGG